jgi:hypothetical protein
VAGLCLLAVKREEFRLQARVPYQFIVAAAGRRAEGHSTAAELG